MKAIFSFSQTQLLPSRLKKPSISDAEDTIYFTSSCSSPSCDKVSWTKIYKKHKSHKKSYFTVPVINICLVSFSFFFQMQHLKQCGSLATFPLTGKMFPTLALLNCLPVLFVLFHLFKSLNHIPNGCFSCKVLSRCRPVPEMCSFHWDKI